MMDSRPLFHLCVGWIIYVFIKESWAQMWNIDIYSSPRAVIKLPTGLYITPFSTQTFWHTGTQGRHLAHRARLPLCSCPLKCLLFFCGLIFLGVSLPLWPAVINSACSKWNPPLRCGFAWETCYSLTTWVCFHTKIIPRTCVNAFFNWQWQDSVWSLQLSFLPALSYWVMAVISAKEIVLTFFFPH